MASFVPKPASLGSTELARKVVERPECFCIKRGVLPCYRPLREQIRDGLGKFSSLGEGICLIDIGFGQWKDRDLQTALCDLVGGK